MHKRRNNFRGALGPATVAAALYTLAACASTSTPPHPLEGTSWRLVDVETSGTSTQLTPELASRHKLTFAPNRRLQLQLDCNRGNSNWTASVPRNGVGTINIGDIASTRALCPKPTFGEEMAAELPSARNYTLSAEKTVLGIQVGETLYAFARDTGK